MGTNYYFYKEPACPHCGHRTDPLHIGKSSGGWVFALRVYPDEGINSLADWTMLFDMWIQSQIKDEYGLILSPDTMLNRITDRKFSGSILPNEEWYKQNHAIPGPNGLARSEIDGIHCIEHGEGTWDLHRGEFS